MLEPSVNVVHVKRKRDEEGPQALVIDQRGEKKQQTYHGAIFRRIDSADTSIGQINVPHRAASAQVTNTFPVVRTTQPGEENRPPQSRLEPETTPPSHLATQSPLSAKSRADLSALRRFHLSRRSLPASQTPTGGVEKKRKRDNVPVFEERRKVVKKTCVDIRQAQGEVSEAFDEVEMSVPKDRYSFPRKRPGASAAEKQWRAQNQSTLQSKRTLDNLKQPPQEVVSSLERASQDIENEEAKAALGSPNSTPKKRGPKVPALRYKDRHPEEFATNDHDAMNLDMDDDGDYVYDTYVRDVTMTDALADHAAYGLLVIADEDQELWETFEDNSDSEEFDTDDEDENAEDYYGADYPEDEVDSDDETGVDLYKYRQGASDNEEFDAENAAWSDEEEDPEKPWKNRLPLI